MFLNSRFYRIVFPSIQPQAAHCCDRRKHCQYALWEYTRALSFSGKTGCLGVANKVLGNRCSETPVTKKKDRS